MVDPSARESNQRLTSQILELLALKPSPEHPRVRQKALTTDEYYATELPSHKKYLLEFHVKLCDCGELECLNAHSPAEVRRIPVITESWKWSYFPHKCKQGASCTRLNCSKSHNDDEVKYHPTVYKTKQCLYPLSDAHVCTSFGLHCPFAHSEKDLRSGLRPESSGSEEEGQDTLAPPIERRQSQKISAPPFQGGPSAASNLQRVQLRTSIEHLQSVLMCGACRQFEKEWLLDCGHLVCSVCCSGQLKHCPTCGMEVGKFKAVRFA